jgi:hypothetical protein
MDKSVFLFISIAKPALSILSLWSKQQHCFYLYDPKIFLGPSLWPKQPHCFNLYDPKIFLGLSLGKNIFILQADDEDVTFIGGIILRHITQLVPML